MFPCCVSLWWPPPLLYININTLSAVVGSYIHYNMLYCDRICCTEYNTRTCLSCWLHVEVCWWVNASFCYKSTNMLNQEDSQASIIQRPDHILNRVISFLSVVALDRTGSDDTIIHPFLSTYSIQGHRWEWVEALCLWLKNGKKGFFWFIKFNLFPSNH